MTTAHLLGTFTTRFGKWPEASHRDLCEQAIEGACGDAGLDDLGQLESIWFSNCDLWVHGQASIRGQTCLSGLVEQGVIPAGTPIINVEGACASGSLALHAARTAILAGTCDLALVVGVERLNDPACISRSAEVFLSGTTVLHSDRWAADYQQLAAQLGKRFVPSDEHTVFMDTYALQANWHMQEFGTTALQLGMVAAKNHRNGCDNPRAQYSFELQVEDVLSDRMVSDPLTRSMCAPISDGAAAVVLCSEQFLKRLSKPVRERAVNILACELAGGSYRRVDQPGVTTRAANRAYAAAGCSPDDLDLVELHDATAYSEIYQSEALGLCPRGGGGKLVESGATAKDGRIPINRSGGLLSRGHPIAATGLAMIHELCIQIRGEAEALQVPDVRLALAENGGGQISFDEAICAVTILSGSS